jgi:hypothetical protein
MPAQNAMLPKEPAPKVPRSIYEEARDVAGACGKTRAYAQSRRDRKKVEMLFAHLKRILRLGLSLLNIRLLQQNRPISDIGRLSQRGS